ncbi:MAG: hypothetical protein WC869_12850 [Phycisphaerae bacterium]|jgi:hypothetical protein
MNAPKMTTIAVAIIMSMAIVYILQTSRQAASAASAVKASSGAYQERIQEEIRQVERDISGKR